MLKKFSLVAALAALVGSALCAADPVAAPAITGDSVVPEYRIVRLSIAGLGPKDGVSWAVRLEVPGKSLALDFAGGGKLDAPVIEFVGPPDKYVVEAIVVSPKAEGGYTLKRLDKTVEIIGRIKPPVIPPVNPIDPVKPIDPVAPVVDDALVKSYREALAKDVAAKFPGGGTKESAAALAEVYVTAADMLEGEDSAQWPATVGELLQKLASASGAGGKKIPTLPYLSNVRSVSSAVLGSYPGDKVIDSDGRKTFAAKFRSAALALKKATNGNP